jgi:hypothetical protein
MARQYFVIKTPKGLVAGVSKVRKSVKTTKRTKFVKSFATYGSAQKFIDTFGDIGFGMTRSKSVILPFSK